MNYKKLALTVAAGAMATTMMAQSAPKLNANNIEEVIKNIDMSSKLIAFYKSLSPEQLEEHKRKK